MIRESHFVGLSGIGGVQRNFVEYINNQTPIGSKSDFLHKVYTFGEVDSQYRILTEVYDIKKINNLFSLIKEVCSKKDIVHFYNNLTSLKLAIFLFFIPVSNLILHERGTVWNFPYSRRMLLRFIAWKAHLILANSNATKIMLKNKFCISEKKIRVLHNGININTKCKSKAITRNSSTFCIGFIGRLDTPKGVHVLIDAMQKIAGNNIELRIIALKEYFSLFFIYKFNFNDRINNYWFNID